MGLMVSFVPFWAGGIIIGTLLAVETLFHLGWGYVLINPLCMKNIDQNSSGLTSPTDHPRLAPLWRCGSL